MPAQLSADCAWMQRESPHTSILETTIELDRVENVRRLRLAVGDELVVLAPLPVGVVEVDITQLVTVGADHDDAARGAPNHRGHQAADQYEVTEMIGPELKLEAIGSPRERRGHDAR